MLKYIWAVLSGKVIALGVYQTWSDLRAVDTLQLAPVYIRAGRHRTWSVVFGAPTPRPPVKIKTQVTLLFLDVLYSILCAGEFYILALYVLTFLATLDIYKIKNVLYPKTSYDVAFLSLKLFFVYFVFCFFFIYMYLVPHGG